MKRATLLGLALALTGCGNLLGIEVLTYDGGDDASNEHDGASTDGQSTHDATEDVLGTEGATADAAPDADATTDATSSGDSMSAMDSTSAEGSTDAQDSGGGLDGPQDTGSVADTGAVDTGVVDTGAVDTGAVDTGVVDTGSVEAGCATGATGCTGNTPWSCVGGVVTSGAACSNQTCVSGVCTGVCAPGQTQCASGNSLFQSCQANGTWGTTATCTGPTMGSPTCDPTTGCGAGTCSSAANPNLCGNACTNLTTDAYNCGLCGQTCTGASCAGGYCATLAMCDGSSITGVTNTGNASRLALQIGTGSGLQKVLFGYFGVSGSVYDCQLPSAAPSSVPAPAVDLARVVGVCSETFGDVVNDKSNAYVFETAGSDCHGSTLHLVPNGADIGGPAFGTLVSDVAGTEALFTLASPVLELVNFGPQTDGGITTASTACMTVSGTLGDGAAGGGFVVAVDTVAGVIRGATSNGTTCSASVGIASGVTSEGAVAVAPSGTVVAFTNGTNLYVCPSSGCTAAELSTPYATGVGAVARNGLVFDGSSSANLYFVGSAGLSRCAAVAPGGTCTPTLLVPGVAATSGLGLDSTYAYYLQGMVLTRVSK